MDAFALVQADSLVVAVIAPAGLVASKAIADPEAVASVETGCALVVASVVLIVVQPEVPLVVPRVVAFAEALVVLGTVSPAEDRASVGAGSG